MTHPDAESLRQSFAGNQRLIERLVADIYVSGLHWHETFHLSQLEILRQVSPGN